MTPPPTLSKGGNILELDALVPGPPCNGWSALCAARYSEVTFPVTHAAMANANPPWMYPSQRKSLRQQLDDSIRGLMLEVHERAGDLTLCAGDCAEGYAPLQTALRDVHGFLADNPREVVHLIVDNRVPASNVAAEFAKADLGAYLLTEPDPDNWSALGERSLWASGSSCSSMTRPRRLQDITRSGMSLAQRATMLRANAISIVNSSVARAARN